MLVGNNHNSYKKQGKIGISGEQGCWSTKRPLREVEPPKSLFCRVFADGETKRAWLEEEGGKMEQHMKDWFTWAADNPVKNWYEEMMQSEKREEGL